MININESFTCEKCGKFTPEQQKTCRNHCINCLFSKHVDETVPGDRKSTCTGLMRPIEIVSNSKKGKQIKHECIKCNKLIFNKIADDDNLESIIAVMNMQNHANIARNN